MFYLRRLFGALLTLCLLTAAGPAVAAPVVPLTDGKPLFEAPFRLDEYGYGATEYFVSGTARSFIDPAAPPAPFTTRILVYRPTDPARFSGTTVLEWANVTGQVDTPVELMWAYRHLLESGHTYVQVSAQQAGVCAMGVADSPLCTPMSLKGFDPQRYGSLHHPGDLYADDIFSQAARAARDLVPETREVIAVGESQSAIALDNYIRSGADDAARVIDGFLIDADGHTAKPTTYRVPTVTVWSEESARPDPVRAPNHATWSVAGLAHTDHWLLADAAGWAGRTFLGAPLRSRAEQEAVERASGDYGQEGPGLSTTCVGNNQFPRRYVVAAAIEAVRHWIRTGEPAPDSPPLVFTGGTLDLGPAVRDGFGTLLNAVNPELGGIDVPGILGAPFALVRDADGNAAGGLRLPPMNVPVAAYHGSACVAAGTTTPFTPERLRQLYPTHADYIQRMADAITEAVDQRFLTPADGRDLLTRACDSAIPEFGTTPPERQPARCGR
ncbi:alpha/beta hydrolase domain-containing protein [Nocardia sp. NPDC050697]|uniref:alpha/beta hydrolase domain-containing protein n=1 Tax=Nocardia sp. NPDC050697 TaxID=3155158 RepID=UPI0033E5745D